MFIVDWEYVIGARCSLHNHLTGACQPAAFMRGFESPIPDRWERGEWYFPALWAATRQRVD